MRLTSHSRSITERAEGLVVREEELDRRAQAVQVGMLEIGTKGNEFQERRAEASRQHAAAEWLFEQADEREHAVRQEEDDLREMEAELVKLEAEATRCEAKITTEEAVQLEERNSAEMELERCRNEHFNLEERAAVLHHVCATCNQSLQEVLHEEVVLCEDEALLTEIEIQVAPVRRGLAEREQRISASELEARIREADCEEREARFCPEYQRCIEALASAEERLREVGAREQQSEKQRSRLVQRQRDLGGAEIRPLPQSFGGKAR